MIKDNIYSLLHHEIKCALLKFGMVNDIADDAAHGIISILRRLFGGGRVYFQIKPNQEEINSAIKQRYDGTKVSKDAICADLGISESSFYRVLRKN